MAVRATKCCENLANEKPSWFGLELVQCLHAAARESTVKQN